LAEHAAHEPAAALFVVLVLVGIRHVGHAVTIAAPTDRS